MRRPAPLPADRVSKADQAADAAQPRARGSRRAAAASPSMASLDRTAPPADPDAATPGAMDAEPQPTSARDVWRAARARRRALRAEIRRFTQRSRRRRIVWMSGIGTVLLLVGGSFVAAYSPLFAVERITVLGASMLDPAVIEQALSNQVGTPLALVDTSEVKAALLAFPLIETYALEAKPPHDLTVRIVERTPVGVLRSQAGYTLVDAAGVALSTTTGQPAGQPLLEIEGGTDSSAFESAGLVVRSLPADVRAALTGVTASTADDVTLTLSTGLTIVWGSAERSPEKAEVLAKSLVARPDATTIDVTSPAAVVIG